MAAADKADYGLDNAWRDARARLSSTEERLDPGTIGHLRARGVGAGWRCLEVGGGGSIARWLCAQVDPGGEVLATDLDTRFLEALEKPNRRRAWPASALKASHDLARRFRRGCGVAADL
jgi:hypothetical protein